MDLKLKIKIIFINLAVVCLLAPFNLDILTIPITLQTFVIFSVAALFGKKTGFGVALLYLVAGAAGLPVFGGFTSGYQKLYGPTAGFLWALPFINYYLGWECERREKTFFDYIMNFIRAHCLLLIPGFVVLYFSLEGIKLWSTLVLLLPGLLIKSIAGGVLTSYFIKKLPPSWTEASNINKTNLST